jgi:hypothetical protein
MASSLGCFCISALFIIRIIPHKARPVQIQKSPAMLGLIVSIDYDIWLFAVAGTAVAIPMMTATITSTTLACFRALHGVCIHIAFQFGQLVG